MKKKAIDHLKDLIQMCDKVAGGHLSIYALPACLKALEGEDFIVFNNGGILAFDIMYGEKPVKGLMKDAEINRYIYFAKCGDKEVINRIPSIHPNYGTLYFL